MRIVAKGYIEGLQSEIETLKSEREDVAKYLDQLKAGNLDGTAVEGDNILMTSLQEFSQTLKKVALEENQRNWTNEGLASFAELLRGDTSDLSGYYNRILASLVKYLSANQGGLFILNEDDEDDKHLELVAYYAYERKKYLERRVDIGEGLVGQIFLEQQGMMLTDVPENYIEITSGVGHATPRCICLIPLKVNDIVLGVVEIASFNIIEPYKYAFLEKMAENMASAISSMRINIRTQSLLQISQRQAGEMREQEEELRQNMEELAATQELIASQLEETKQLKMALEARERVFNITTILSESDLFGTITYVNDKLCEISKYSREELLGKGHNVFRHPDMPKLIFEKMWSTIKAGNVFRGVIKNRAKDGSIYWVDAAITPIMDANGKVYKYIGARYHIQNEVLAEAMYQKMMSDLGAI